MLGVERELEQMMLIVQVWGFKNGKCTYMQHSDLCKLTWSVFAIYLRVDVIVVVKREGEDKEKQVDQQIRQDRLTIIQHRVIIISG